jgi:hypothetical protein
MTVLKPRLDGLRTPVGGTFTTHEDRTGTGREVQTLRRISNRGEGGRVPDDTLAGLFQHLLCTPINGGVGIQIRRLELPITRGGTRGVARRAESRRIAKGLPSGGGRGPDAGPIAGIMPGIKYLLIGSQENVALQNELCKICTALRKRHRELVVASRGVKFSSGDGNLPQAACSQKGLRPDPCKRFTCHGFPPVNHEVGRLIGQEVDVKF